MKENKYDEHNDVVELGTDFFKNAVPFSEAAKNNPALAKMLNAQAQGSLKIVPTRGKQKAPLKQPTTIRLSPAVTAFFKAKGKGWQTRIDEVLCEYVAQHQ